VVLCHVIQGAELGKGNETWLKPENIEITRKSLEEHYYRFKLNQTKEGITTSTLTLASLKDLVRLANIGPAIFAGSKY